jgi:autotransporter-associated beta strand protein
MKTKSPFGGMRGILTVTLCLSAGTYAQTTWNGTTNTDWATSTNWGGDALPPAGGNIIIADTTTGNALNLDVSRSIGSLTYGSTGTRITGFTLSTGVANTLTLSGGVIANGAFPANNANALLLRGNYLIDTAQTWTIAGSGANNSDQGVFLRESGAGVANRGTVTLDANLTKEGAGQLQFAATDVLGAGNLIINEGSLKLNAGSSSLLAVGGTGNITMNNAAVLSVVKNSGTISLTRPIVMNGTSALVARNNPVDIASNIAFTGTHTLDAGGITNLTGDFTGSGVINRIGTGTVTLSGDSSGFTGTLNSATGQINLSGNFGGNLAFTGGTLNSETSVGGNLSLTGTTIHPNPISAASLGSGGDLSLAGSNLVSLTAAPASSAPFTVLSYGGTLTGGSANLELVGGVANYRSTGFDTSTLGVITFANDSQARTWAGGASWDVNNSTNWAEGDQKFFNLDSVTFGETGAGTVAIVGVAAPGSIAITGNSDYTFTAEAGNSIAGVASIVKSGNGTTTLGGVNTYFGGVTINGGVLKPQNNQALGANGQLITINAGGTLDFAGSNGANRDYQAVISGAGAGGVGAITNSGAGGNFGFRSITLADDATLGGTGRFDLRPITAGTAVLDLAGHTLTKSGTNTIAIVDGNATSDGSIIINGGILGLTRTNVTGTGSIDVNAGGQLYFENNSTAVTISKAINLNGGTDALSTATLRAGGNALAIESAVNVTNKATFATDIALTLNNGLSGSGTITKTGANALILRGDNSFSGAIEAAAASVIFDPLTTGGFAGGISGAGAVTKQGAGTTTLTGSLTNTGNTNINGGSLKLGASNAITTTGLIAFANTAGANVDLAGFNQEFRTANGGGTTGGNIINTGASTSVLAFRPTGGDGNTYSGAIQGDIRLEVLGNKTAPGFVAPRQRLGGTANTFTGGILVEGATLMVTTDGSLGAVPVSFDADNIILRNHGTLLNQADNIDLVIHENRGIRLEGTGGALVSGFNRAVTVNGVISGAAEAPLSILPNNNPLFITGNNTYEGSTLLTAATSRLTVGNGGLSGTLGSGDVTNEGVLTFNRSNDSSYGGAITGAGVVNKQGAGTLTLSGTSTYTGATNVTAGTLLVNGALGNTAVSVSSLATVGGDGGSIAGPVTSLAPDARFSPGNSPGTLTFGSLNVSAGATFDFELGTLSDLLVVTGEILAGAGALNFDFQDSGGFASGETYTLINFGSQTGLSAGSLNAGAIPNGLLLDTSFGTDGWAVNSNSLQVRFIPEPSTALLAGLGLLAALRRRRGA